VSHHVPPVAHRALLPALHESVHGETAVQVHTNGQALPVLDLHAKLFWNAGLPRLLLRPAGLPPGVARGVYRRVRLIIVAARPRRVPHLAAGNALRMRAPARIACVLLHQRLSRRQACCIGCAISAWGRHPAWPHGTHGRSAANPTAPKGHQQTLCATPAKRARRGRASLMRRGMRGRAPAGRSRGRRRQSPCAGTR